MSDTMKEVAKNALGSAKRVFGGVGGMFGDVLKTTASAVGNANAPLLQDVSNRIRKSTEVDLNSAMTEVKEIIESAIEVEHPYFDKKTKKAYIGAAGSPSFEAEPGESMGPGEISLSEWVFNHMKDFNVNKFIRYYGSEMAAMQAIDDLIYRDYAVKMIDAQEAQNAERFAE